MPPAERLWCFRPAPTANAPQKKRTVRRTVLFFFPHFTGKTFGAGCGAASSVMRPILPPRNSSRISAEARSVSGRAPDRIQPRLRQAVSITAKPSLSASGANLSRVSMAAGCVSRRYSSRRAASVSVSMISPRIEPRKARCSATVLFSNFGQSIPGVSRNSRYGLTMIHCLPRVTPGLSPALATAVPRRRLIKVDLPTFGMPTIMARTVLFTPLAFIRSTVGRTARSTSEIASFTPLPALAEKLIASQPAD